MMLALKKIERINIEKFIQKFHGNPIYIFKEELDRLKEQELIEIDEHIKLTNKGIDFANLVWEEFV